MKVNNCFCVGERGMLLRKGYKQSAEVTGFVGGLLTFIHLFC